MLKSLKTAAVVSSAMAALSLPGIAHANHYNTACNAQENEARLAGGIIGAVAGAVAGSQVAGNGARTEGSAIGAVLGGLAGAGIGDKSVECNPRRTTTFYRTGTSGAYGSTHYNNGYYTRPPAVHAGYRDHTRPRQGTVKIRQELRRVNQRLRAVNDELNQTQEKKRGIKRKIRNGRHGPNIYDRLDRTRSQIRQLRREKQRLQDRKNRLRQRLDGRRGYH